MYRGASLLAAAALSFGTVVFSLTRANPPVEGKYPAAFNDASDPQSAGKNFKHPTLASNSKEKVGARLVCLFDISGSVDSEEYKVQLEAMADAIASEDFRNAIFYHGGPQSIAICVADFGSSAEMRIPWVDIRRGEEKKLKKLADEIRALTRRESGSTNHLAGLQLSVTLLTNCPWQGRRNIVDDLTDGKHNFGGSGEDIKAATALLAKEHNATVNALITLVNNEPDLEKWIRTYLITPPNLTRSDGGPLDEGFVKVVATQASEQGNAIVKYREAMEEAFRRKLILEVAGITLDELRAYANKEVPALPPLKNAPSPYDAVPR